MIKYNSMCRALIEKVIHVNELPFLVLCVTFPLDRHLPEIYSVWATYCLVSGKLG